MEVPLVEWVGVPVSDGRVRHLLGDWWVLELRGWGLFMANSEIGCAWIMLKYPWLEVGDICG